MKGREKGSSPSRFPAAIGGKASGSVCSQAGQRRSSASHPPVCLRQQHTEQPHLCAPVSASGLTCVRTSRFYTRLVCQVPRILAFVNLLTTWKSLAGEGHSFAQRRMPGRDALKALDGTPAPPIENAVHKKTAVEQVRGYRTEIGWLLLWRAGEEADTGCEAAFAPALVRGGIASVFAAQVLEVGVVPVTVGLLDMRIDLRIPRVVKHPQAGHPSVFRARPRSAQGAVLGPGWIRAVVHAARPARSI